MVASIGLQILLRLRPYLVSKHRLLCSQAFAHHSIMHGKHSCHRNLEHLALVKHLGSPVQYLASH